MSDLPPNEIPIAVVGLGCRFPGADSLDDYWQLIRQGRSGIVELPPDKIDLDLYYDPEPGKLGRSYTKLGGVVAERPLDPAICRLPQKLLHNADPAHLIMCEVAAMAFRHAGYDPDNIPTPHAGVYIGHSGGSVLAGEMACHNYAETVVPYLLEDPTFRALPAEMQQTVLRGVIDRVHRSTRGRRADGGPEIGASNVSALISQAFGLSGPALATDAACASSLIAMAMGIHALRHGQIDMAVVGGASCSKWYALVLFSQAKSISGTGSRPFDANADGLISSDGYAAVVLKTLPRALKDGDPIQAIIRGIGVSSDGRGKSLWAPRKEGQILAVHRAYGRGIDPAWLQYIECHATSTQVGDSTELGALNLALKDKLPRDRKLPIGSVKANIGHTLESAGIAGFCKAVLSMRHRTIPGQIHFQTPNPDVPWNDIPFYVPTESQPWPEPLPGRPRRTAVNAFGIGGLNVHVVLDDQLTEATKTQVVVPANPATGADDEAIAIIGASAIFPGALTLAAFWDLLASGRDPKREVPADRWSKELYYSPQAEGPRRVANALGGFITDFVYDWKKHKVPPKQMANANPLQFMLLDAADQALRDSGYDQKAFDKQRAAVIVGSVYGGDFACEMQMGLRIPEFQKHIRDELRERGVPAAQVEAVATAYQDLLLQHMPALQDETGSFTASTLASRLTKTFDLMGGAFSIDAHDVSSLASIGAAVGMLQDRAVDMVLCAAGQRSMDINVYEGFQLRKVLAKGRPQPAFTEQADGVVPGEGVGVLILKRLSDARRDGDTIRAVIRGVGAAVRLDAHEIGCVEAATRALAHANVPATAVSVVESASIGLSAVDQTEATALAKVLPGEARAVPAILSSVTPQIGHTLGVSGMAAVLKATVELEHGQVPATPGMTHPLSVVTTQPNVLRVATQPRPLQGTLPQGKTAAVVTNSAANGAVYALVLEGGAGLPSAPVPTTTPRVGVVAPDVRSERKAIRLAAAQRADLSGLCRQQAAHAAALFASGGAPFTGGEGVRLTILADSAEGLERQLQFTADHLQRSSNTFLLDDKAIFVQDGRLPGKTAFLFPGQGSQYAGMLRPLIDEVPAAKSTLAEIDATLRQTGCPTFAEMAWDQPERLGSDVFLTQLAMLVSSVLSYRVLESQGLRPDVVSCHSYGEFSALVAIGVLSLRDAILATRERTRSVETRESTKGVLLSTTAPLELVEQVLGSSPGGAYLASHNAPDQCVIGGTADAVQGVKRLLEAEGFATRMLAVPRPYHTPLLAEAQGPFAAALAGITFEAPKCSLISSVSLKPVTSGADARRNLVDQLVTPVRYVQLVEQLLTSGVTTLIEVGPNRVLTRLNQRILPGKPVTILPMDVPQHPGREGLIRIQTVLASAPKATQGTSQESPLASRPRHEILFFDATQHRRGGRPATTVSTVSTPAPVVAQVVETPSPVVVGPTLDRAAVTRFMIRYVVDQTGYPEEMVELTADLEADLGIDSIKKAQLIGELAENFELTHLAGSLSELSLDDFRTLEAILEFVTKPAGATTPAIAPVIETPAAPLTVATTPAESAPVLAATNPATAVLDRAAVTQFMIRYVVDQTGYPEEMVELTADLEADLGIDSIKKAQLIGELAENFELTHLAGSLSELSLDDFRTLEAILEFVTKPAGHGGVESAPAVVATLTEVAPAPTTTVSAAPATSMAAASTLDRAAVTQFMIRYVVDQTGYPEEMVELTADLEADLGIDSIKKAQLIGELAENFELAHLAGSLSELSLDDFRTLEAILEFVAKPATSAVAPTAIPVPAAQIMPAESVSQPPVVAAAVPTTVGPLDRAAVTRFMIRYVVDQTGYPEEMVELTADLEADLGIDSIKKAQLIGELAENFELTHLAGSLSELSLDDFRTLDAILTFVMAGPQTTQAAVPPPEPVALPAAATIQAPSVTTPLAPTNDSVTTPVDGPWDHLPEAFSVVTLAGSDYEIGRQHGQSQAPQIRAIMERYAAMLGPRLQNIPELDAALAKPTMYFGEAEIEELKGIADGAGLPHGAVLAHNLGMYPDYVPGCTQFAFTKQVNPRYGLVHAVNEDSPLSLTLPDCLSRIVQIRRPTHGLAHVTFSVSGQSGGLNGINEAGLAITSTLLLDCPRRKETAIGKVHPVLVKRLLERAESIEEAVKLLRTLDRAGAWSLCLSEFRTDRLCYLEYDGDHLEVQEQPKRVLTTNHCLLQTPVADVPEHSRHRLARLQQLLAVADRDGVPLELAQQTLRDRYDLGRGRETPHATMNTIRRVDNQISIVMRPEHGEIYVTPGPRSGEIIDTYYKLEIGDLFLSRSTTATEQHADARATTIRATTHASSTAVQIAGTNGKHHPPMSTATEKPGSVKFTTKPFLGDPRTGLPPEGKRVVQRHVLRMDAAPLPAGTPERPPFQGPVLLLGRNKLTEALRERLQGWGHACHVLPADDSAVAALELHWTKEPALQLIVTTARDGDAATIDRGDWAARSNTGVLVPFLVCQKWAQLVQTAGRTADATLMAVTALGGDFGIGGRVHSFEGGGLTGLLKGLRRELADMTVKVIDAPLEEAPEGLAKVVLQEAAHRAGPLEVGSIRGRRFVVRAVPQPASAQRPGTKTPHGAWVVTGGARGVTAVVARELGRRFGLKMHLLGSTAEPAIDPSWRNLTEEGLKTLKRSIMDQARAAGKHPAGTWKEVERAIEIDRTLQAFRADGIAVTYHACDVSDRAPLAATLDRIRKQDGPISGVIHGAGLEAACRFDKKKRDLVAATLGVKVDAAVHLAALTADDPLEYFLGFGSTSGRFGGMGQCDYSMASDMLCKLCAAWRQARPNVAAIGLHWPPWADVGMAARPESKIALQSSNLAFMPPLEGAAHVIDELLGRAIEGELLFLDKPDLIDTDGTMPDAALKAEYLRRDPQVQRASLVETIHGLKPGSGLIATLELDPTSDPFLLEHRHQGQPILPAVVGMESFAEAGSMLAADGRKLIGLRDMTVHQGLRFLNERTQRAKVTLEHGPAGLHARLVADFQDRQGRLVEADRLQMEATLELAADYAPLPDAELGPVPTDWMTHRYVVDWRTMKFPEEARVYHGVPFQALRDYALVDGGLWARLIVPPPALIAGDRSAAGWQLPSATIDAGLLGADLLVWHTLHVADLPQSFDRIRLARPLVPGEALTLRVWLRGRSDRRIDADFVMVDAAGRVVIQVDGYHMVEVKTGTTGGTPVAPIAAPAAPTTITPATTSGPAPAPIPGAIKPKAPSLVLPTNGPTPAPAPLPGTQPVNGAMPPVTPPQGNIPPGMTHPAIAAERIAELPLIDAATFESPDKLVTTTRFDPSSDPFLDEHRFSGKPLLPAVIGLETMIEAVSLTAPAGRDFVVRSFRILAPCKFVDHTPQTLRVVVERQGDGWVCQLVGTTGKPTVYQTAVIAFPDQLAAAEAPAFIKPSFPFSPMQYANGKQAQLIHGPRFQCLKGLSLQREWGWGRVIAAAADNLAGSRRGRLWFLPVATLDSCLVACGVDLFILMNMRVEVPHGIEELRIVRLPNADETCTVRLKFGGSDDRHTKYDLFLYGAQGDLLLTARGYQGIRTSKGADSALWDGDFSNLT